jgi:hypothetical protein
VGSRQAIKTEFIGDSVSAESCGIKDYLNSLVDQIRADERERAARIVEEWPVDTNYIVGKIRIEERRQAIAKAIREQK